MDGLLVALPENVYRKLDLLDATNSVVYLAEESEDDMDSDARLAADY